jgi:hypothetical protein
MGIIMQKKHNFRIYLLLIIIIFLCGIGSAVSATEDHSSVISSHNKTTSPINDEPSLVTVNATVVIPGRPADESDRFHILKGNENFTRRGDECTAFDLKAAEERNVRMAFYRSTGMGNVSYIISDTPLNVTVIPSEFFAMSGSDHPAIMTIRADPALPSGNYSFTLDILGAKGTETYSREFFVNVWHPWELPLLYQQSPLLIALPIFALLALGLFWRVSRRKG